MKNNGKSCRGKPAVGCSEIIEHQALIKPAAKAAHHKTVSEFRNHGEFYVMQDTIFTGKMNFNHGRYFLKYHIQLYSCTLQFHLNINNTLTKEAATIDHACRLLVEKNKNLRNRRYFGQTFNFTNLIL